MPDDIRRFEIPSISIKRICRARPTTERIVFMGVDHAALREQYENRVDKTSSAIDHRVHKIRNAYIAYV